jgi:hypothetical protein
MLAANRAIGGGGDLAAHTRQAVAFRCPVASRTLLGGWRREHEAQSADNCEQKAHPRAVFLSWGLLEKK